MIEKQKEAPAGKRNRGQTTTKGKATGFEIAKALGERGKLPKEQEEATDGSRNIMKDKEEKQKAVERQADISMCKLIDSKADQNSASIIYQCRSGSESELSNDDDINAESACKVSESGSTKTESGSLESGSGTLAKELEKSDCVFLNRILHLKKWFRGNSFSFYVLV